MKKTVQNLFTLVIAVLLIINTLPSMVYADEEIPAEDPSQAQVEVISETGNEQTPSDTQQENLTPVQEEKKEESPVNEVKEEVQIKIEEIAKELVENGGTSYREGTGVDIYEKATGHIVGYNQAGEWLEYTVNVAKEGDYTVYASVATDNETAGFSLSVDGESVAEIPVSGSSWDEFVKVKANVTLPAGEHVLRLTVTGDWFDIDYIQFAEGKDAKDPDDSLVALRPMARMNATSAGVFDVFNLNGKKVASFTARSMDDAKNIWRENALSKKVQGICLIRDRSNGIIAKVRTTR